MGALENGYRSTVDIELPTELLGAVRCLVAEWEKARGMAYVRQPVSFALYETWRKIEKEEMKRNEIN